MKNKVFGALAIVFSVVLIIRIGYHADYKMFQHFSKKAALAVRQTKEVPKGSCNIALGEYAGHHWTDDTMWPSVIIDPNFEYAGEMIIERATADGLSAWALCMAGNDPPENFGLAMVKISKAIGKFATPENLMQMQFVHPVVNEWVIIDANVEVVDGQYIDQLE